MDAVIASSFPRLAGISTYERSAQLGYTVAQDVERLIRYAWLEKQAMELGLAWLNPTPEWEVKEALSLHVYLDAQHVGWVRERVSEMRNPAPRMDVSPSVDLKSFIDELLTAQDTLEKIIGLYGVFKPALLAAYRQHFSHAHPLADHATRRMLKMIMADEEEVLEWGQAAVEAVSATPDAKARADAWSAHLRIYLQAAGPN